MLAWRADSLKPLTVPRLSCRFRANFEPVGLAGTVAFGVEDRGVDSALPLLIEAASFAAEKHRDQRRKVAAASPYINHPLALAKILTVEAGITDPIMIAAARLHDTIEDTQTTEAKLRERFGDDVVSVVLEVTDDKSQPKARRKRLQIEHAAHASSRAKLVKLADKTANLRDILHFPPADWPLERREDYAHWAKRVVDALRGGHPEMETIFDVSLSALASSLQAERNATA